MAETGGDGGRNPFSKEDLPGIVENQLADGMPEETGRTLARLLEAGYSRDEAIDKIGTLVVMERFDVLKSIQPFDERHSRAGSGS